MGTIVLKNVDLNRRTFPVPNTSPLVFNLFDEPTEIKEIINNTSARYYVRLFTNEFYINIDPNANYVLKSSEDYDDKTEKHSIKVKTKLFTHGIARKTVIDLKYNEMIFLSDNPYTRRKDSYSRSVTFVEGLIDYYEEEMEQSLELKHILEEFFEKEQECTNKINDKKQEISKCEEKNTKLKEKPDPKSSNIWWTILYLTIMLIVTYLIFGSIPYIVVTLVIGTFMLEMQYGDGFSRLFMYIFYLLLPTMITLFIIKSVFGISGSPNPYNRYNPYTTD